jgi:ATP-dependent DNA helicase RecG
LTAGVPQAWLRKRITRALATVEQTDVLHAVLRDEWHLPMLSAALRRLHQPPPDADARALAERTDAAWQRLKFDELVAQQIALRQARAARQRHRAPALHADGLAARLLAGLPFRLTRAQQRVWREVEADLAREHPMQRLVQGDVGSGKTVIAHSPLRARRIRLASRRDGANRAAGRAAFRPHRRMAPPLGVRTTWLAGRLGAAAKRAAQQLVSSGTAQLAIGTHALIQDAVNYDRLGLAIVDEQHRFGVAQRLALRGSDRALLPHMLMLSATPIPRTLAMSFLADLDVSVIDQLPPGRRPVVTKLVAVRRRDEVLARIRRDVAAGRQAYWVCPLVEESAAVEAAAATETHERIARMLPELRIGLLHGQLPGAEKTAMMQQFASRSIDVLVTTTVIEVGVDVPNATLMVIEHAERFGLAQLHPLRGRIGRGVQQSCILLLPSRCRRLRVSDSRSSTDERWLRGGSARPYDAGPGRGPGGRQSGVPLLRWLTSGACGAGRACLGGRSAARARSRGSAGACTPLVRRKTRFPGRVKQATPPKHDTHRTQVHRGRRARAAFRPRGGRVFRQPADLVGGDQETGGGTRHTDLRAPYE